MVVGEVVKRRAAAPPRAAAAAAAALVAANGTHPPPLAVSLLATLSSVSSSGPLISISTAPSKKAWMGARAFCAAILALRPAAGPFQMKKTNLAWRMALVPAPPCA